MQGQAQELFEFAWQQVFDMADSPSALRYAYVKALSPGLLYDLTVLQRSWQRGEIGDLFAF